MKIENMFISWPTYIDGPFVNCNVTFEGDGKLEFKPVLPDELVQAIHAELVKQVRERTGQYAKQSNLLTSVVESEEEHF